MPTGRKSRASRDALEARIAAYAELPRQHEAVRARLQAQEEAK